MIGRATLLWMLLAVCAGLGLFVVKYEVQSMEERLVAIHERTLQDLESVHVLQAEWSYLNRPARLETLGRRLLDLGPVAATQSVSIRDIPFRPDGANEAAPPAAAPAHGGTRPTLATFGRGM